MIRKAIGDAWKIIGYRMRARIVRATQSTFTVSAAAVILNQGGEVLILNHVLRPASGWGLPGGFLNTGEQPDEGIRREIREETGIELDNLRMFRVRTLNRHIEILFTATTSGKPEVLSREILGLGWFTSETLPPHMSSDHGLIAKKVLAGEI